MEKYIAIGHANHHSGITTYDAAIEWAQRHLADNPKATKVHLTVVEEVVEKTVPPIKVSEFKPTDLSA
jgi:hypothetical protein